LQCAGTTGVAGTSLAEFNLNANGTDCPGEYAYAYDDANGLHTCPTGSNYTGRP
jgi:hypothetical protein